MTPEAAAEEDVELPEAPNLAEVMAAQTWLIHQLVRTSAAVNQQGGAPGNYARYQQDPASRMQAFMRLQPSRFDHSEDPLVADGWLRSVSKKLDIIQCDDAECVRLATHLLEGIAATWWDNCVSAHEDRDNITWDEFAEEFRLYHISEVVMTWKAEEFRNIRLGSMSVTEYTNRYAQLSRYVPREMGCEEKRMY